MVFDVCNRDSFDHVGKWVEEAKTGGHPSLAFVLVGNKSDKAAEFFFYLCRRKVTFEEGLRLAKAQGIAFLETSAITGSNVNEIFDVITEGILGKI